MGRDIFLCICIKMLNIKNMLFIDMFKVNVIKYLYML